jgi:hypothetical protein
MSNEFKIKKGLVVEGDARVTGAIFDSTNAPGTSGQVLTSTVTGTDWKSLAEISGVDGTGTANYLSKWADADTITNSIVYDNGTNVGIGTASPNRKLVINGEVGIQGSNKMFFGNTLNNPSYIKATWVDNNSTGIEFHTFVASVDLPTLTLHPYGNVGIGTTSPNRKLEIVSSDSEQLVLTSTSTSNLAGIFLNPANTTYSSFIGSTGNDIVMNTVGAERIRITSAGNVGIGTTSPSAKLSVNGYIRYGAVNAYSTTGLDSAGFYQDVTGTTAVQSTMRLQSNVLSGVSSYNGIKFGAAALNNVSEGFTIYTGGYDNNRLSITSAGNVGIGTSSPGAKLEVFGTGNTLRLDSAANGSKEILFRNVGTGTATIKTDGDLKLYVEDAGKNILFDTTGGEKMRITAAGNVGIGTTRDD